MIAPVRNPDVTSLGAFRLKRAEHDALLEDTVMRALKPMALRRRATLVEIEAARKAALAQLAIGRTPAWAIRCGELELPRARKRARRPVVSP